jgi:hypothetical protein
MALIETPEAPVRKAAPKRNGIAVIQDGSSSTPEWNDRGKIAFRFFFIYFLLQAVPLDWKYYRDLLSLDWTSFHFSNFFYLARYAPRIFSGVPVLADWIVIAAIALVGMVTWSIVDTKNKEYNGLYYWLRVIVRYRLAAALLAYGFIKVFPMQMPFPSVSNLNTNYGDLAGWKIFSMSTGIVPGYQSFLGLVEVFAALLLLNRRTASIGAFIVLPFTGNVVLSNLAYEGGEYTYALLLITFALFLFAFDAFRLIRLTAQELPTTPAVAHHVLKEEWQRRARLALKSLFVFVFVFLYGFQAYAGYREGGYHYPAATGLSNAEGVYTVREFRINSEVHPYSAADPARWRDVVFEKWPTISIRSGREVKVLTADTEEIFRNNNDRLYEISGSAGRHYYSYTVDSVNHSLRLHNRNPNYPKEDFVLKYERPDVKTIVLSGVDANQDSLYVVLDKLDKKYLLEEAARQGRRRGLKL